MAFFFVATKSPKERDQLNGMFGFELLSTTPAKFKTYFLFWHKET
jgi:hypothetical protein